MKISGRLLFEEREKHIIRLSKKAADYFRKKNPDVALRRFLQDVLEEVAEKDLIEIRSNEKRNQNKRSK